MNTPLAPLLCRLSLIAWLTGLAGCTSARQAPQVLVIGDVTEAGKKLTPPNPEHPVYYFPLPVGYKELGAIVAGEKQPPKNDVSHALAVALARQGYRVMDAQHPPEQLLVFWWGSMNPKIDDFSTGDPDEMPNQVFFNEREMLALVGAYKADSLAPWESHDLRTAAREDRYFVIVLAFDFEAARKHEKKLLWMAKMSTESLGRTLTETFPALIASGGPAFGQDTKPGWVDSSQPLKQGKVIVAPLEVKEYLPSTPPVEKK